VIAIPFKRYERNEVSYLNIDEIKALLAAPDRTTWLGRRDHAILLAAVQTGVRVTELVTLRIRDVSFSTGAHCQVTGKGRLLLCLAEAVHVGRSRGVRRATANDAR
jgi:integrase/recombinase XerD